MHGKRRRKSSCAPFKHIISMRTEDQHDHPHSDELGDGVKTTSDTEDDSYKNLPRLGHDESASEVDPPNTVTEAVVDTVKPVYYDFRKNTPKDLTSSSWPPPEKEKNTFQHLGEETHVAQILDRDQQYKLDKERDDYQKALDDRPIMQKLMDLTPEQSEIHWKKRDRNLDALQVGLSVGGIAFPPADAVNFLGSLVRAGDAAVGWSRPKDWDAAKSHGKASLYNLAALVPYFGDTAGVGFNLGRFSLKHGDDMIRPIKKGLETMNPKKTWDYLTDATVSTKSKVQEAIRAGGTLGYWLDDTGTIPTFYRWLTGSGDDDEKSKDKKK